MSERRNFEATTYEFEDLNKPSSSKGGEYKGKGRQEGWNKGGGNSSRYKGDRGYKGKKGEERGNKNYEGYLDNRGHSNRKGEPLHDRPNSSWSMDKEPFSTKTKPLDSRGWMDKKGLPMDKLDFLLKGFDFESWKGQTELEFTFQRLELALEEPNTILLLGLLHQPCSELLDGTEYQRVVTENAILSLLKQVWFQQPKTKVFAAFPEVSIYPIALTCTNYTSRLKPIFKNYALDRVDLDQVLTSFNLLLSHMLVGTYQLFFYFPQLLDELHQDWTVYGKNFNTLLLEKMVVDSDLKTNLVRLADTDNNLNCTVYLNKITFHDTQHSQKEYELFKNLHLVYNQFDDLEPIHHFQLRLFRCTLLQLDLKLENPNLWNRPVEFTLGGEKCLRHRYIRVQWGEAPPTVPFIEQLQFDQVIQLDFDYNPIACRHQLLFSDFHTTLGISLIEQLLKGAYLKFVDSKGYVSIVKVDNLEDPKSAQILLLCLQSKTLIEKAQSDALEPPFDLTVSRTAKFLHKYNFHPFDLLVEQKLMGYLDLVTQYVLDPQLSDLLFDYTMFDHLFQLLFSDSTHPNWQDWKEKVERNLTSLQQLPLLIEFKFAVLLLWNQFIQSHDFLFQSHSHPLLVKDELVDLIQSHLSQIIHREPNLNLLQRCRLLNLCTFEAGFCKVDSKKTTAKLDRKDGGFNKKGKPTASLNSSYRNQDQIDHYQLLEESFQVGLAEDGDRNFSLKEKWDSWHGV